MNLCIEDFNPNWKQDRWMKDFSPETEESGYRCQHCQLTFSKPELHDCHWAGFAHPAKGRSMVVTAFVAAQYPALKPSSSGLNCSHFAAKEVTMDHSYFRIRCAGSFFNKETRTWGVCDKLLEREAPCFICPQCGARIEIQWPADLTPVVEKTQLELVVDQGKRVA